VRLVIAALVASAGSAEAGGLADAIARHAPADVDALRGQLPGDVAVRCTLGAVYAKRNELPRAAVYLTDCEDAQLPTEISEAVAKLAHEMKKKLRESELSVLEIVTKPAGMTAEISALPGDPLVTPATVWVPAGTYDVKATTAEGRTITNHVSTTAHSRSVIILEEPNRANGPAKPGTVNFDGDGEPAERHEGTPAAIKHGSLMSKKLRGIADPAAAGPQLDDPLAIVEDPPPPAPPGWRIGARIGSGATDHVEQNSPLGLEGALESHFVIAGDAKPYEIVVRADTLIRTHVTALEVRFGASAAVAKVIAAPDAAWIAVGLGVRGMIHGGVDLPRQQLLGGEATLELALRRLPIVVDARFEQGLVATQGPDAMTERALVLELGYDFRVF
jgi:hypothetical protein